MLLQEVEKVFERQEKFNIKLENLNTDLCALIITWCGRQIGKYGIIYDSDFVQEHVDLLEPTTAAELQKFVTAVSCMRSSIPDFRFEIRIR